MTKNQIAGLGCSGGAKGWQGATPVVIAFLGHFGLGRIVGDLAACFCGLVHNLLTCMTVRGRSYSLFLEVE